MVQHLSGGGGELFETIRNSEITELATDIGEFALDSLLDDGLLREIPIIGWAVKLQKLGGNVREAIFVRKLVQFLAEVDQLDFSARGNALEALIGNRNQEDVGEIILSYIERSENAPKSAIFGKLFKMLGNNKISSEEFWQICHGVSQFSYNDLLRLKQELPNMNTPGRDHRLFHLCVASGLAHFEILISGPKLEYQQKVFDALFECIEPT